MTEPVRSEDPPIAFKVPVALADDGRLVKRADAIKGERYRCPACETDLVFKAGAIRARHFAHAPTYACHPETVLHETAKRLIAQVVTDWAKGTGPCPTVRNRCKLCYRDYDEPLRGRIDEASVEYRLSDGLVADIALLRGQNVVAIVEILVSHAVDGDKAARLTVPWLELRGVDIVADPVSWKPVASGSVRPVLCNRCATRDRSAADLCRALGIEYDRMRYLAAAYACYRCQKKTPVFAWTRGQHHEVRKPPQPQPRTIQWRYTRTVGHRYWANTCAHCGWGFGDWHLFMQPDGPFFGRPELQDDGTNNVDLDLAPLIERIAPRRAAAPASPYEVDVVRCRECRAETRYFTWDGVEPPDPRPETVRLVGSPPRSASPSRAPTGDIACLPGELAEPMSLLRRVPGALADRRADPAMVSPHAAGGSPTNGAVLDAGVLSRSKMIDRGEAKRTGAGGPAMSQESDLWQRQQAAQASSETREAATGRPNQGNEAARHRED